MPFKETKLQSTNVVLQTTLMQYGIYNHKVSLVRPYYPMGQKIRSRFKVIHLPYLKSDGAAF